jgi:hypothetical protein
MDISLKAPAIGLFTRRDLISLNYSNCSANFLAECPVPITEPFQRTDINVQPLGPTILDIRNCGFHK